MSNSNIRRSGKTVFLILTPLIVAGLLLYVPWVPESTKILFLGGYPYNCRIFRNEVGLPARESAKHERSE